MEKIMKLYRKLTLANFLNWFGIKFYHKARFISYRIISIAIRLDSSRDIFQKNLDSLELDRLLLLKKINLPYHTVLEGCKNISSKIIFHKTGETIDLELPKVINPDFKVSNEYACKTKLPDTYLVKIDNAQVFSGTDLIVVNKSILYDEIDKNDFDKYGIKSPMISRVYNDSIRIKIPTKTKNIEQGIHFTKDHSKNYFHWIIECLPRLSLIDDVDSDIPLLIDQNLPKQFYDALEILNHNKRELIKLDSNITYLVKKLYYPSQLSIVHDNYNKPIYDKDALYSSIAINYIRNNILKKNTHLDTNKKLKCRRLYISRKNSNYRQLLNSNEIEELLVQNGFEIVFPEYLSFFSQVQIFSQAEIIIGQSGAGMANFIFAPKDCKILIMMSDVSQTNLHLFGALAKSLDMDLEYIIGKSIVIRRKYSIHSDFYVDTKLLADYLNDRYPI